MEFQGSRRVEAGRGHRELPDLRRFRDAIPRKYPVDLPDGPAGQTPGGSSASRQVQEVFERPYSYTYLLTNSAAGMPATRPSSSGWRSPQQYTAFRSACKSLAFRFDPPAYRLRPLP